MTTRQLTFEGLEPVGVRTSISGKTTSIQRPAAIGEQVVVVVRGTVQGVNHAVDKDGLLWREHKLVIDEAFELDGLAGDAVLSGARAGAQQAADRAAGREPLPFDAEREVGYEETAEQAQRLGLGQ